MLAMVVFLCGGSISYAQRSVSAQRITEPITLDGELKEAFWNSVPIADSFVINYPTPGLPANCRTTVQMAYDDQAVYFGVLLHDVTPDSVLSILSQRDDFGNADWFGFHYRNCVSRSKVFKHGGSIFSDKLAGDVKCRIGRRLIQLFMVKSRNRDMSQG